MKLVAAADVVELMWMSKGVGEMNEGGLLEIMRVAEEVED